MVRSEQHRLALFNGPILNRDAMQGHTTILMGTTALLAGVILMTGLIRLIF